MTNISFYGKPLTLYNIAKHVLDYTKVTDKHREIWCDPLEENVKLYARHLYLKPRGTYKSTLYTVSFTINLLLQDWFDHDGKFTKRILVASATNELAQQFVGEVKQHLTENEKLHRIFGYNPVKRDNQQEVWLYPRVVKKEPNIKAKGALSSLTSEHYDIIIADDICNNDDRESETIREKKKRWLQDLISILEPDGLLIVIGTRWHCVLPGAMVQTSSGIQLIEKLHGNVVTSNGIQIFEGPQSRHYEGDIVKIRAFGYPDYLNVTPNHQIYTNNGWKYASDITTNDYIALPIPQNETSMDYIESLFPDKIIEEAKNTGKLTGAKSAPDKELFKSYIDAGLTYQEIAEKFGKKYKTWTHKWADFYGFRRSNLQQIDKSILYDVDFWKIIGIWLAEGTITYGRKGTNNVVRWSIGYTSQDLMKLIKETLSKYNLQVNGSICGSETNITCSSWQIATFLEQFGKLAYGKLLPEWAICLPEKYAMALYFGYSFGDGYSDDKHNALRIGSASLSLMTGFQRLLSRFGIFAQIYGSYGKYELRTMYKELGIEVESRNRKRNVIFDSNFIYIKVNDIKSDYYSGPVYDIKTESHDFVANGMLIHNSDDLYQTIIDNNKKLPEASRYHIEIEAVVDENDNLLFPTIIDHEKIKSLKIEKGLVEYYSQYMNNPLPAETQLFALDKLHFYDEAQASLEKEYNYAYMDPALGSIGKGDNDLIVVLFCARKENTVYVRDCIITNTTTPDEVIKEMKELYDFYDCSFVGVESNGYQTLFAKSVREMNMVVNEVRSNKPKVVRIESIAPAVAVGKVKFRDDWKAKYPELIEQMVVYPVGKNDDVPDSVHGALTCGLKKLSGLKKEKLSGLVTTKTGLLRGNIYGRYSHEKAKEARGWRSRNRA